jgi:hypothetical protein
MKNYRSMSRYGPHQGCLTTCQLAVNIFRLCCATPSGVSDTMSTGSEYLSIVLCLHVHVHVHAHVCARRYVGGKEQETLCLHGHVHVHVCVHR